MTNIVVVIAISAGFYACKAAAPVSPHVRKAEIESVMPDAMLRGPSGHLSPDVRKASSLVINSLDPVDQPPHDESVADLGRGMTGSVRLVRMADKTLAALKCSHMNGHPLLRGYGPLLDTRDSEYFPDALGYYKLRHGGDCVYMEVTGPTLKELRDVSMSMQWPQETLASIGLQLLRAVRRMHTEFGYGHRDLNPSNLAVSRYIPSVGQLPTRAMLIDFDFAQVIRSRHLVLQDVRAILVSLRYLHNGDGHYWAIDPTLGTCRTAQKSLTQCMANAVGIQALCEAIVSACSDNHPESDEEFYDATKHALENLLTVLTDTDEIIWPGELSKLITRNMKTVIYPEYMVVGNSPNLVDSVPMDVVDPVTPPAYQNSINPVDTLPEHMNVRRIRDGGLSTVDLVEMPDGRRIALRCSKKSGHLLLRGYGHLIDAMSSKYVPEPLGYYKLRGKGDCVFMEATGPSLAELRRASGAMTWPPETIASIGLQLLDAAFQMHTEFGVTHRDLTASNIAVTGDEVLPKQIMLIGLDFAMPIHSAEFNIQDVRALLVTLRYLFDEDETYMTVNPLNGQCVKDQGNFDKCVFHAPAELTKLCRAIEYACTSTPSYAQLAEYYGTVRNLLRDMLLSEFVDRGIVWPHELARVIRKNLASYGPII
jgi:tRNA A-37 threonylcarbamoyl transferase component Bud32